MRDFIFILKNYAKSFVSVLAVMMLMVGFLLPVPVHAQNVAGFTECDFSAARNSSVSGTTKFQSCIRQVLTFVFVIGLFVIAFRIGLAAFNNLNPQSDSKAVGDSIKSIQDIFIGLILIGAPALILGTLNPALLNISFLDLGRLGNGSQSNVNPVNIGGNTNGGSSSNPTNSTTAAQTLATRLEELKKQCEAGNQDACDQLKNYATQLANCQSGSILTINAALGGVFADPANATCDTLTNSAVSSILASYNTTTGFTEGSWLFGNNTNFLLKQETVLLPSAATSIGNNTFYLRVGPKNGGSASSNVTLRMYGSSCVADNPNIFANGDIRKDSPVLNAGTAFKTSANCQIIYVG